MSRRSEAANRERFASSAVVGGKRFSAARQRFGRGRPLSPRRAGAGRVADRGATMDRCGMAGATRTVVAAAVLRFLLTVPGGLRWRGPAAAERSTRRRGLGHGDRGPTPAPRRRSARRIPGVGDRLQRQIPAAPARSWRSTARARTPRTPRPCCTRSTAPPGTSTRELAGAQRQEGLDHRPPRGRQAQPRRRLHAQRRGRRARRTRGRAAVHAVRGLRGPALVGRSRTGTTSTTSSPSTTTASRAPRRTTRPAPRGSPRAAGSGCTWTTAAVRRPASACPSRRWSTCCARSTRTGIRWW